MTAVMLTGERTVELRRVPVPAVPAGHCLVRTAFVGICGTDAALYAGTSTYLQQGLKSYPFIFGHEYSGVVVAAAPDVYGFGPGTRVAGHNFITCGSCEMCRRGRRTLCRRRSEMGVLGAYPGAAADYFVVPANVLIALPNNVSLRDAALLEPASTVLHAIIRTRVAEDDRVAVFGTGTLGLVAVQIAKAFGAHVDAIGVEEPALALARELGADRAIRPENVEAESYTVVIEASGAPSAAAMVPTALAAAGRAGIVGVVHRPVPSYDTAPFVLNDLEVHGVLGGVDYWDRLAGLVAGRRINLSALVHEVVPSGQAPSAFEALLEPGRPRPKVLISFAGEYAAGESAADDDGGQR